MRLWLRRMIGGVALLVVLAYASYAAFFYTVQRQLLFPLTDGQRCAVKRRSLPQRYKRYSSVLLALLLSGAMTKTGSQPAAFPTALLDAATAQIGVTLYYDPAYARIAYPGGDVPPERGVCTDVVIRAYRGIGVDLQQRVHEDMRAAWAAYPRLWGLHRTDRNIDHRRVPNLATFFTRHGRTLAVSQTDASLYAAGDVVTWRLASGVPHIGLVSAQRRDGRPLIVHNIGAGAQREDMLFDYVITGHYRYEP